MLERSNVDFLKSHLPFWNLISDQEAGELVSNTKSFTYKKGDPVHSSKKECGGVLLVKSGELRTYILSKAGKDITLYWLGEGEVSILAASPIRSGIMFDINIDAEQDTEVLFISADVFSRYMKNNVYIENFILRVTVDRCLDAIWTMEQILFMSLDRRLAIFLLDEIAKTGTLSLSLTQEQIAGYIGSAREVVSRMLKYFVQDGIVTLNRGVVTIIDKDKLKKLVS